MLAEMRHAVERGIDVCVMLRKAKNTAALARQDEALALLREAGCGVRLGEGPSAGIAVFDETVAWYGTLPLLAFARGEDCSLRLESAEIAGDLAAELEDEAPESIS